jgi:hypothetical protein
VPLHHDADDRTDGDAGHDEHDEHGAGRRDRYPLPGFQERKAPHEGEDRAGKLGGEVGPEPEPGTGVAPRTDQVGAQRAAADRPAPAHPMLGSVADDDEHQGEGEHAGAGRGQERDRPPRAVQEGHQGHHAQYLSRLSEQPGYLGQNRYPPCREPRRDQAQHADEGERVAGADQRPAEHRDRHGGRHRQYGLADNHDRGPAGEQATNTEAVEQHTHRDLQAGIDEQLQDDEARQHARRGVEAVGGLQARDAEGGPVEDRHAVGDGAACPDQPRARGGPHVVVVLPHRRLPAVCVVLLATRQVQALTPSPIRR